MFVPNNDSAFISSAKLFDYLLNEDHPDDGSKARFFKRRGFDAVSLSEVLMEQVQQTEYFTYVDTTFGRKYVLQSEVIGPDGVAFTLRTIWIIRNLTLSPSLITAYPIKQKMQLL